MVNFKFDFPVQDAEAGGQKATKIEGCCHSLRDCATERLPSLQTSSLSNAAESSSLRQLTKTVRHASLMIILTQKVCPGICAQVSAAFATTANEELDGLVAIFQKVAVPEVRMLCSVNSVAIPCSYTVERRIVENVVGCSCEAWCQTVLTCVVVCGQFFHRVLWERS